MYADHRTRRCFLFDMANGLSANCSSGEMGDELSEDMGDGCFSERGDIGGHG